MARDMKARAFFLTYPTPCAIKAWALKARAFLCMARDSEKKKPTTTQAPGVREVGRCHAPVMDKAGDLFGKFTRQIQNGVCLDFALPAPQAKRRMLRGGKSRAKKVCSRQVFLLSNKYKSIMHVH